MGLELAYEGTTELGMVHYQAEGVFVIYHGGGNVEVRRSGQLRVQDQEIRLLTTGCGERAVETIDSREGGLALGRG